MLAHADPVAPTEASIRAYVLGIERPCADLKQSTLRPCLNARDFAQPACTACTLQHWPNLKVGLRLVHRAASRCHACRRTAQVAYNARYPMPAGDLADIAGSSLDMTGWLGVVAGIAPPVPPPGLEAAFAATNNYYSVELPGCHIIVLSSYVPYGAQSKQVGFWEAV